MTYGEIQLWRYLRQKQMLGYKFIRQKPILDYIADFFCNQLMLVIEIDGRLHDNNDRCDDDVKRQKRLESKGLTVLRFNEGDILNNLEEVIFELEGWILNYQKYTPQSPLTGGEGRNPS